MNDEELAEAVVALGVGCTRFEHSLDPTRYKIPNSHTHLSPEGFVRDWRVAGALLERCEVIAAAKSGNSSFVSDSWNFIWPNGNESLPRAIIEACVEALKSGDTK